MIKLTIDNQSVEAPKGASILKAAKMSGIHIPTLCFLPGLAAHGACRICLVETEGSPKLMAACSTEAAEGMVVNTKSERVLSARRMIVELLLSEGDHNCLICTKNGTCELQEISYSLGVRTYRYAGAKARSVAFEGNVDDSHPLIQRNDAKCILCNRCVMACTQKGVHGVLFKNNRGFETKISCGADNLEESGCVACGECVQACPVGALIESKSIGKGHSWELSKTNTTCVYCGVGCQITVHVDEKSNKAVKVTGRNTKPNEGMLCVKGRFAYDFPHSDKRIHQPLIKKDGEQVEVSWDEALDFAAKRLKEAIGNDPDAYAGISCARSTNENNYAAMKFARAVIGTNNIDNCARSCHAPTVAGLATSFGSGAMTNSIQEIRDAKVLFVTGSNTTEAHPVISYYMKQAVKNGATLIVSDPRRIDLCEWATVYVQQKVGTDVAYLNGLMHIILRNGKQDQKFIDENCENWDGMKKVIESYTPEKASEICGVPVVELEKVAGILGDAESVSLCYTLGITEHTSGTDNVKTCANLQMLLGNLGKYAAGVNPLRGQNNVQGACDMGALPNTYHNYQKVDDPKAQAKFEKAWGVSKLPNTIGMKMPTMFKEILNGKVKTLFCYGENIVMTEANQAHTINCLSNVDFLMVADIFHNQTTEMADIVFPCTSWGEEEGTYTNSERRIQRVRPFLKPVGEEKEYWWIVNELGKRIGYDMGFTSSNQVWEELRELGTTYKGISWERCEDVGLQWPCPDLEHSGTKFLHEDGKFIRGKGLFSPCEWRPQAELPDADYPFVLTTGRRLWHYHTTQTRNSERMDDLFGEEMIEISHADAERLNIKTGDTVLVSSRRGKVEMKSWVTERSPEGICWTTFHFHEACGNILTIDAFDPVTETPEFKACAINVVKIADGEPVNVRKRQARP